MKYHIQEVHALVEYPCNFCNFIARRKGNLTEHIQGKHTEANIFCNQCDYKTSIRKNLKQHVQNKHSELKMHCNQCDYRTSQKQLMQRHMQAKHEYNKCHYCNYRSRRKRLKEHIQAFHGILIIDKKDNKNKVENIDENIFACQYCSDSRFTWTGLMKHIKIMHMSLTDPDILDNLTEES